MLAAGAPSAEVVKAGAISGKVTNPKQCKGVRALMRIGPGVKFPSRPKVISGDYDPATGEFKLENLPDGQYDLRLLIDRGMLDGVDLRLDPPKHGAKSFGLKDEEAIREVIANLPSKFVDTCRPIIIHGSGSRARVLVEKIRHTAFHSGRAGETIWRVEVWSFEKRTGAWVKTANRPVICRVRVPQEMKAERFHDLTWLFSPELGGFEIGEEREIKNLSVTVPKPEDRRGKLPGSVKKQIEADRAKRDPQPEQKEREDKPRPDDKKQKAETEAN